MNISISATNYSTKFSQVSTEQDQQNQKTIYLVSIYLTLGKGKLPTLSVFNNWVYEINWH